MTWGQTGANTLVRSYRVSAGIWRSPLSRGRSVVWGQTGVSALSARESTDIYSLEEVLT